MQIYDKPAIDSLWEIVKPLSDTIPIYREVMTEDKNGTPNSYVILRSDVTNYGEIYGDGESHIRVSDCDIILVSKGFADTKTCTHNVNKAKINALLKQSGVAYRLINLGYIESLKSTECTWALEVVINA